MDITNNISINDNQTGGDNNELVENQYESSDYDVTLTDSIGGDASISENNINNILNGNDIELDNKNFNINDLNKNPTFNKLSNNHKTLVINRILEKVAKLKNVKSKNNTVSKDSYFYCKCCGYNELIPDKMFIFSRGDEKKDDLYNYRFLNYKHDNTLPYTKKYNCINDKCITHKEPEKKLAVFYRQSGYNIRYICTICDKYWNTFIEKKSI